MTVLVQIVIAVLDEFIIPGIGAGDVLDLPADEFGVRGSLQRVFLCLTVSVRPSVRRHVCVMRTALHDLRENGFDVDVFSRHVKEHALVRVHGGGIDPFFQAVTGRGVSFPGKRYGFPGLEARRGMTVYVLRFPVFDGDPEDVVSVGDPHGVGPGARHVVGIPDRDGKGKKASLGRRSRKIKELVALIVQGQSGRK